MANDQPDETDIREDILEAIHTAFPDGTVDMPFDDEECHLAYVFDELRAKLAAIEGTHIPYERKPYGGSEWEEDAGPEESLADSSGPSSSYHLFFVGLSDAKFRYQTETDDPDYDSEERGFDLRDIEGDEEPGEDRVGGTVRGEGTPGCVTAVSLVAPFALIEMGTMEHYDTGGYTVPDIGPRFFSESGEPVDSDIGVRETVGEEAYARLCQLRDEIAGRLDSVGIAVLPREEGAKPATFLEPGEDAWIGTEYTGSPTTVGDAFFFRGP